MEDNKKIYLIDLKFKKVFQKICWETLQKYNGVLPIQWEDIYYPFLYSVPKLLEKFDPLIGVSEQTYLFLECKYFANNLCRKFTSSKHKVMNFRTPIKHENSIFLSDSQKEEKKKLDISLLTDFELQIYKMYFLDGYTYIEINKKINLSLYKIRSCIKKIREKLNFQLQ